MADGAHRFIVTHLFIGKSIGVSYHVIRMSEDCKEMT